MTDKGIIFSAPMVRALLEGRKSQTRRVIGGRGRMGPPNTRAEALDDLRYRERDRLWVREVVGLHGPTVHYRADEDPRAEAVSWRSPIHMPRRASRLTLTVNEVRVQRLQQISEADAIAEGCALSASQVDENVAMQKRELLPHIAAIYGDKRPQQSAIGNYACLWNSLHGPAAWDANPWVVAVSFEVTKCNIDQIGAAP